MPSYNYNNIIILKAKAYSIIQICIFFIFTVHNFQFETITVSLSMHVLVRDGDTCAFQLAANLGVKLQDCRVPISLQL